MIKNKNTYFRMQSLGAINSSLKNHLSKMKETLKGFLKPMKGSVTLEGTFAITLCLFVFAAVLSLFNLLGGQIKEYYRVDEINQKEAVYALVLDGGPDNITSYYEYADSVALLPDSIRNYIFSGEIIRKSWTGRSLNDVGGESSEEYVYVAENGSVYHTTEACTHLKLTISEVAYSNIDSARNQYGDKYTRCELCGAHPGEIVYVGAEGDRYHSTMSCSGLKRTYKKVKKSEISLPACSRCGE